jgi:hypothetical protein
MWLGQIGSVQAMVDPSSFATVMASIVGMPWHSPVLSHVQ